MAVEPPSAPGRGSPLGWLVAAGCVAFVLFLAALAYEPDLAAGRSRGADALSRSPVGYAAVVALLRADGADVRLHRTPGAWKAIPPDALVMLTPRPGAPVDEIAAAARQRRVLLVPAKWIAASSPAAPQNLARLGLVPPSVARDQAQAVLSQRAGDGRVTVRWEAGQRAPTLAEPRDEHDLGFAPTTLPPVAQLRTVEGDAVQAVLVNGDGRAVLAIARGPLAYVLADPDVINNHGVATLGAARAAARLLEGLADGGPIVFDLTLAGVAGGRSPVRALFEPPLLPASLAALLLAGLVGLSARSRFGALRRPPRAYAFGKRALVDSAASLLAVAGREPRLAPRYADLVRADAAAAAGLSAAAPDVDATLDGVGLARGASSWSGIVREAPVLKTREQLMDWARRAAAWRREMTHGRG